MKLYITLIVIAIVLCNDREIEERNYCRKMNRISYEKCEKITRCGFCNVNGNCGWCKEKKKCLPVIYDSSHSEIKTICNGECTTLLSIDKCYETVLDEKENFTENFMFDTPQYEESEWSLFISSLEAQKINLWLKGYSIPNDRTKEKDNKEKYLKKFYKNVKYNKTQLNNNSIASLLKQNKVINTELKSEIAIKRIISNANNKK